MKINKENSLIISQVIESRVVCPQFQKAIKSIDKNIKRLDALQENRKTKYLEGAIFELQKAKAIIQQKLDFYSSLNFILDSRVIL